MTRYSRLSSSWRRLREHFRPAPIDNADALKTFLQERAAFIAQKCAIDYCRGKTGLASFALFTEKPFIEALAVCRWETFAVVFGDLMIVAEGALRPHVALEQRAPLCAALIDMHAAVFASLPAPAHRTQGWGDVIEAFVPRFTAASAGNLRQALDVADHSAKRLFDTLPIHARMRRLDEEVVYGSVRFRMVAVSQELQRRLLPAEVVGQLLAARKS